MDSYGSARFLQQVIVNRVSQKGGISWLAEELSAFKNDPAPCSYQNDLEKA
jgi:hypothetical protein